MLKSWLFAGMLVVVPVVGCGDAGQGEDDLNGSEDNLKKNGKQPKPAADAPKDETKDDPKPDAPKPEPREDAAVDQPKDEGASACAAVLCPVNTRCVVKEVQCIRAPCPPIASCEPIEALPTPAGCAATLCREGTTCVESPTGAQCVEQTCTAKCSAGQHCELQEVQCIKAPCLPVPTCVDDLDACATVRCKDGTHCESIPVQCFVAPCPEHAECVPN